MFILSMILICGIGTVIPYYDNEIKNKKIEIGPFSDNTYIQNFYDTSRFEREILIKTKENTILKLDSLYIVNENIEQAYLEQIYVDNCFKNWYFRSRTDPVNIVHLPLNARSVVLKKE